MLSQHIQRIQIPSSYCNILENLSFRVYDQLPKWAIGSPNPMFMSNIFRMFSQAAWHSNLKLQFLHSLPFRMLRAITTDDLKQVEYILNNPMFKIDSIIDQKYGYNSLQFAAIINRYNTIELLLMHGANINHQDRYGNTALMLAAQRHNLQTTNSLMKNGCNRQITNNSGITALQKAKKNHLTHIYNFIKNYPEIGRKFPKFTVRLQLDNYLNNEFWISVKSYKIPQNKPKVSPFNNFKGTYIINMFPCSTVQKLIQQLQIDGQV